MTRNSIMNILKHILLLLLRITSIFIFRRVIFTNQDQLQFIAVEMDLSCFLFPLENEFAGKESGRGNYLLAVSNPFLLRLLRQLICYGTK